MTSFHKEDQDDFWMNNFNILYKDGKYTHFFPKYNMSRNEQLNAITRFCIYFILIIVMFQRHQDWLYLPITMITLVVLFYNVNRIDDKGKRKEFERIMEIRQKLRNEDKEKEKVELGLDEEEIKLEAIDTTHDDNETDNEFEHEAGFYYDSDGNVTTGKRTKPPKYKKHKDKSLFTVDEYVEYKKNTCRKPTNDNPFMNPFITEYNDITPPEACNIDDDKIKDDMMIHFNHDLFRDVDELWERKNSQRQFYTVPNTAIPNNQKEFAEWLYKIPYTCKEDQENCLRYEDLRFKR